MKRITERDRYGKAVLTSWGSIEDMIERLADYEDTGLDPEYINELVDDSAALVAEQKKYLKFSPGQMVYAIERDEYGKACDVSGYMFLAVAGNEAILSVYINDIDDLYGMMEEHVIRTREGFRTTLCVFPLSDCYETCEEAEAEMEAGD